MPVNTDEWITTLRNRVYAHTAMVFIPVRLVTVALPPRMSMEDTMTFVASLHSNQKRLGGVNG